MIAAGWQGPDRRMQPHDVVLGLNLGHDRSACLMAGGNVRVAIAEERLSRIKHDLPVNARGERFNSFPHRAVEYCLSACGLRYSDVDLAVASTTYVLDLAGGSRRTLRPSDVREQCPQLEDTAVEITGHHLAHAASAALCSGFAQTAVLVVDGGGSIVEVDRDGEAAELERTSIMRFARGEFELLGRAVGRAPAYGNSIGDLYQLVTRFLGFRAGEEGKTMGLASFAGSGTAPLEPFAGSIAVDSSGDHTIDPVLQFTPDGTFHPALLERFGEPRLQPRPQDALDQDIAASAQWEIERAMVELAEAAIALSGERRLCLAGGVALNCVANARVARELREVEVFIQPASSDDGTALGNALLGSSRLRGASAPRALATPFMGRSYREQELARAVASVADRVRAVSCEQPARALAADIAGGAIVALFRGGCEFGPRALGHRSILCDPRQGSMKDLLNARVKHREAFRPFAPLAQEEHAAEFFELDVPSPYMLLAATVRRPELIPAVTHVDGSARVQTVARDEEPFLWDVLEHLRQETGIPVMLNTSFNDGEPIVETPEDAVRCFLGTGIDVLYLESLRLVKGGGG
jgi:carbamoyltransferase